MIWHHKFTLLTGINELILWFHKKNFTFYQRINVHLSIWKNMDSYNNLIFFVIGHHKHVLLIVIDDMDALVSQEKLIFLPILVLMFVHRFGQTWIHIIIIFHLMVGHHKVILLIGINELMLWFLKKIFAFHHF